MRHIQAEQESECTSSIIATRMTRVYISEQSQIPSSRQGHSMCAWRGKLYLFGGTLDGSRGENDLYVFDTAISQWSAQETHGIKPCKRHRHSAVVIDNMMYVFGGWGQWDIRSCLQRLDLVTNTWYDVEHRYGREPVPRSSHSAVAYRSKLIIFGGHSHQGYLNDVHVYNTKTRSWSVMNTTGHIPFKRWAHSASIVGSHMVVFGGNGAGPRSYVDRYDEHAPIYMLNVINWKWTIPVTDGLHVNTRRFHTSSVLGDSIIYTGGYDGRKVVGDLVMFNTRTYKWSIFSHERLFHPRQLHAAAVWEGEVLIFGGMQTSSETIMNDVVQFTPGDVCLATLQDLCINMLVSRNAHIDRALNSCHLPNHVFDAFIRKMAQVGRLDIGRLIMVLEQRPHLEYLSLSLCRHVGTLHIEMVAKYGKQLRVLDLSGCNKLDGSCVVWILGMTRLEVVVFARKVLSAKEYSLLATRKPDLQVRICNSDHSI